MGALAADRRSAFGDRRMTAPDDLDLDGVDEDIRAVNDLVGCYAGNSQFEAWLRVKRLAETGAAFFALARRTAREAALVAAQALSPAGDA